jgi:hypothetical protein
LQPLTTPIADPPPPPQGRPIDNEPTGTIMPGLAPLPPRPTTIVNPVGPQPTFEDFIYTNNRTQEQVNGDSVDGVDSVTGLSTDRIIALGNAGDQWKEHEGVGAARLETILGRQLSGNGGDQSFDYTDEGGLGRIELKGPIPASHAEHQIDSFTQQAIDAINTKSGFDIVVVDVTTFSEAGKARVIERINSMANGSRYAIVNGSNITYKP